ncbi:MAG: LexA family transcriptional regulator [Bacteroidales bacterium]|nr:LexA family transcriptional regulator [Bacteroidales bacterium]
MLSIKDNLGKTLVSIAEDLGVKPSTLYQITTGKQPISNKMANRIIKTYPQFNIAWVRTGEGEMISHAEKHRNAQIIQTAPLPTNATEENRFALPLIPFDAVAGLPSVDNMGVSFLDCEQYIVPEFYQRGAEFLIRVSGASMTPTYFSGDILACRRIRDVLFLQWGNVYVIDTSQGVLVKRVKQSNRDGCVTLVSDNAAQYAPFDVPETDIRSVSLVVGIIRLE